MADYILDPGETIVERINRSLADLIPVIVSATLIVAAALFGVFLYTRYPDQVPFLTPDVVLSVVALLFLIVILMLLSALYVYLHNYLVVTNLHLIKVQQTGLFARQTSELMFGNIEDVKGGRRGILGTLLDFGDIEVQTAGTSENFLFRTVDHPQVVADHLLQFQDELRAARRAQGVQAAQINTTEAGEAEDRTS
jgi:membrane protein YdbS with pleckstrin-like domain